MSTQSAPKKRRQTVPRIRARKGGNKPLTMLTAYTYAHARLVDAAGVDMILVGDSLANVCLGHETTLPVTVEQMVYHTAAVRRGTEHALVVGDMPFLSYTVSTERAIGGRQAGLSRIEAFPIDPLVSPWSALGASTSCLGQPLGAKQGV